MTTSGLWCWMCRYGVAGNSVSALVAFFASLLSRGKISCCCLCGKNSEIKWKFPVNTPGPIRKRIGPDRVCRILGLPASFLVPVLQRRHGPYCAKPTRIRSGWPGQGLATRIWSGSKPVCRNHLAQFLAGRDRSAATFPLLDSVPFFQKRPG